MKNLRVLIFVPVFSFSLSAIQAAEKKQVDSKPNVLYVIMDDMCDWAHFLGRNNQVLTPNLDRLAARGISFSNAYSAVPLCNPSRTAMFTGMQPSVTGIYHNKQPIANSTVANNSLMMPQHFHDNGYTTLCAGKVFHSKPSPDVMARNWDDVSHIDGGYGPFPKNPGLPSGIGDRWQDYEEWTGPDTDFPDVRNSQKVIEFLGGKHDKPFFVAMGFYRPHDPWTAPKRYFELYDVNKIKPPLTIPDDLADVPPYAIDNFIGNRQIERQHKISTTGNAWEQMVRAYMACVSFTDDRIGMILDALDKSPYADNTLIVLIGDNGFHHGEKERWGKSALWREACHVPLVIVAPRKNKEIGKGNCKAVVNSIDIYPTLIDVCKLPKIENQLAGNSLMPLLKDPKEKWDKPSISTFLPGNFTVHQNQWNYIHYADGSAELYDISKDENEFENLVEKPDFKKVVDSLSKFVPQKWVEGVQQGTDDEESQENSNPKAGKRKRKK